MSYRSDNHAASYDHTLLSSVPDPTRAEKQEGYNVGLLEASRNRSDPPPANGAVSDHNGGVLDYSPGAVSYARKEDPPTTSDYEPVEKRVPWYRTKKGVIGIVVALLVIIAAAVGGGVGGTRHSSHSSKNGDSSTGVGQGVQSVSEAGSTASTSSSASPSPSQGAPAPGLSQGVVQPASTTGRRGVA
jgi:hypothetical protein